MIEHPVTAAPTPAITRKTPRQPYHAESVPLAEKLGETILAIVAQAAPNARKISVKTTFGGIAITIDNS